MRPTPARRAGAALNWLLPVVLGVVAFVLVTGGNMLAPGNVRWLEHSDLAQSYLGWAFYRHGPWTWPWGANPAYGIEFHSSVYYSDSIPLVAMLLKPLSGVLPDPFQYFGGWVLLCFVLQGVFAWRLLSLATPSVAARVLGCIFFLMAPPLLVRLGGHMALFAQWPLLAGMLLYVKPLPHRQRGAWTLLVAASMLIHAYIFLMVASIWFADVVRRAVHAKGEGAPLPYRAIARDLLQVIGTTVVVAWMAGFFMVPGGGMGASGFGYYKMNLLAPLDGAGWSAFGLRWPEAAGEYEGFNYLGAGGLLLCVTAAVARLLVRPAGRAQGPLWPLLLVALLLTLAALTPHLGIGAWQGTLSLPASLEHKLSRSSIQSTGRLFWVAYYGLLLWSFSKLARTLPRRGLVGVLLMLVALQLVDLRPGLSGLRGQLVERTQTSDAPSLQGPFWQAAGTRYHRLRLVPTRVLAPGWEVLARYALAHGMDTDAVQLARVDWKRFNRVRDDQLRRLAAGEPEERTLYVVDASEVERAGRAARPQDAFFRLDGWNVLAPGWGGALPTHATNLKRAP